LELPQDIIAGIRRENLREALMQLLAHSKCSLDVGTYI
jgi:hypothetical protein